MYHKKQEDDDEHQQAIRDFEHAIETVVGRMNGYADHNLQNVMNVVSAAWPWWRVERKQLVVDQIRLAQGVNLKILELLNESPWLSLTTWSLNVCKIRLLAYVARYELSFFFLNCKAHVALQTSMINKCLTTEQRINNLHQTLSELQARMDMKLDEQFAQMMERGSEQAQLLKTSTCVCWTSHTIRDGENLQPSTLSLHLPLSSTPHHHHPPEPEQSELETSLSLYALI